MLNLIEDKESKMTATPVQLFNNLNNDDLLAIVDAGELKNFCNVLTLDLLTRDNEEDTTYKA